MHKSANIIRCCNFKSGAWLKNSMMQDGAEWTFAFAFRRIITMSLVLIRPMDKSNGNQQDDCDGHKDRQKAIDIRRGGLHLFSP